MPSIWADDSLAVPDVSEVPLQPGVEPGAVASQQPQRPAQQQPQDEEPRDENLEFDIPRDLTQRLERRRPQGLRTAGEAYDFCRGLVTKNENDSRHSRARAQVC